MITHVSDTGREFALGRIVSRDAREELIRTATPFDVRELGLFRAPEEIDNRNWMTVEDQGQVGSCSGQAITSVQEYLNFVQTGQVVQLSRMLGYLAGQKMDGSVGQDTGATITGSVKGAMQIGCCLEELFPYTGKYFTQIPAQALSEAKTHLVKNHSILSSYKDCFDWLASGMGGIEIGIEWTASCADCTGIMDRQSGQVYGGHALAVVGYSRKTDTQGRKYLWLLNSHSKKWGDAGWAQISPALFDKWGRDGGSELIGVTDLEAFAGPRWVGKYTKLLG